MRVCVYSSPTLLFANIGQRYVTYPLNAGPGSVRTVTFARIFLDLRADEEVDQYRVAFRSGFLPSRRNGRQ